MKAIKSIAVVGVAAGMLAAGAGVATAHDGGKAKGHEEKSRHHKKAHKNDSIKVVKKVTYVEDDSVKGAALGSPGFGSGNLTQVVTTPQTNACGLTTNALGGVLNSSFANRCENR